MLAKFQCKTVILLASALTLAACGGGSGGSGDNGGGGPPINLAPIADAGANVTVAELSNVNLDGTGSSDPDGDSFSYAWLQTDGAMVVLSDASVAQPSFTSPDVTAGSREVLTFQLTVEDGMDSTTDSVDITVQEALSQVTVAGKVFFEFPPPNNTPRNKCAGLNLNDPETRPIRGSPVQLLDFNNMPNVLGETVSGNDGSYSFANIDANMDVVVRVRAELQSSGPAVWDVQVRDNVDIDPPIPPLTQRPLYVVDFPERNTGISHITDADFTADLGWGGTSYTRQRAAAPFAILDAIMDAMEMVTAVDPTAVFPDLDVYWSVNNTLVSPTDVDAGELSTTFYFNNGLYMLGDANVDTDEFDDHLSIHEWGHYFEDNFSRSDSWGGSHRIGESLDPRLAFGEGFATALAAIALQDPQYCDTSAPMLRGGFGFDTENDNTGNQGYYNEMSVATLIYDLWDTVPDGTDNGSIGFGPIFDTMVGPQANTAAFTTLFSFATELRNMLGGADLAFVDSQLTREYVDLGNLTIYGDGQTTQPPGARDVLPVYTDLPVDGTPVNICTNSDFDSGRDGNKLAEYRYLRMQVTQQRSYQIIVDTVSVNDGDLPSQPPAGFDCVAAFQADPDDPEVHTYSDPDFGIFLNGAQVGGGYSCTPNREETVTNTLVQGMYTLDLQEFRFADEDTVVPYPERVCYAVSATPN